MRTLAEDVYYVPRAADQVIGLNSMMELPAGLTEVELQAIETMCRRSVATMTRRMTTGVTPPEPSRALQSPDSPCPGLYYVGPDGRVWLISGQDVRPDLDGADMDFAQATVDAGVDKLRRLRAEARRLC